MSGIPRTGLFSRNHVVSLAQRNRALQAENVNVNNNKSEENNLKEDSGAGVSENSPSKKNIGSPASSSFASLPRDNEGFDDLDAYFNRATTPQKTPNNKTAAGTSTKKSHHNTPTKSRSETPLTQRKNANVLLAKPVKMIASKFAERYKKEPRLAVSMSEAIEETREREEREERERQSEFVEENLSDSEDEAEESESQAHDADTLTLTIANVDSHEDRIQRAKRELEEMSINSSFDSTYNNNDDTEVHLSSYIKSTLSTNVVKAEEVEDNNHEEGNNVDVSNYDFSMPNDEDVLMDRLVEEMLVNDSDLPDVNEKNRDNDNAEDGNVVIRDTQDTIVKGTTSESESVNESTVTTTATTTVASKRGKGANAGKQRKPRGSGSGGLTRKPLTYLPGAEYTETGQRRSCRLKIEPLRYWANEKVCYGRADDPSITLPVIVNVIKKPELDDPTFAMGLTRKRRRPVDGNVSKLKAQAFGPDCDVETEVNCYEQPGEEEVRLVALSHHHVQGDPVNDCSFRIHTIFTEGAYMSSGQLIFPPLSQKPTKNSARHALVFYVITGSFRVEINRESFVIGPGGQFHVPRANHYTITHVTEDRSVEGRLFFCHCKDNAEL